MLSRFGRDDPEAARLDARSLETEITDPPVDIDDDDPLLDHVRSNPEPVDLAELDLGSPAVGALQDAGVELVVPLVAQGELIGLLNLGGRLSEQEYSSDDRELLEKLAGQAAPALRVAQLAREQEAEARRRERFQQEMEVARLIQRNFLPDAAPERESWDLTALYRPAREVGGDFYDFIELDDDRIGVVVGDVTDKGIPASLLMTSTRSVLRAAAQRLVAPGAVLERVNGQLAPDIPQNMFVTCLYGVLEPDTGRFWFANAGHNLPCVKADGEAIEVEASGMPLGLMPDMTYEENEVTVEPGQSLLLYSDALPEAHGPDGEMFGFPRLREAVADAPTGAALIDELLAAIDRYTADDWEQEDDITVVSIERIREPAERADRDEPPSEVGQVSDDERELLALSIPSEQGREREVMERVSDAVADLPLTEGQLEEIRTAVSEATMNAIEHGNDNRPELPVDVQVVTTDSELRMRISDRRAGGSSPRDVEQPDLEAKLEGEQDPRGWGLFLIRNMVDDLRSVEQADRRTVEMIVRLDGGDDG